MKFNILYSRFFNESSVRDEDPTVGDVFDYLSRYYIDNTKEGSYAGDRYGLYFNSEKERSRRVRRVFLCTTLDDRVKRYIEGRGYDLVISHHPGYYDKVPYIIFHTTMDSAEVGGHNSYFARKMGLGADVIQGEYTVEGEIWKEISLEEFMNLLEKRGFHIDGVVYENKREVEKYGRGIKRVMYCAGMGGMLIDKNSLESTKWINKKGLDMRNVVGVDVFVTGELTKSPKKTPTNFKYIIELGHASSEKPAFKWVKEKLRNRWKNLEIDLAPNEIEYQFSKDFTGDELE